MIELTPVLGRSPCALKRFVNVYRLIKARAFDDPQLSFNFMNLGQYRVVQLLLAMSTGAPRLSPIVFEAIRSAPRDMPLATFVVNLEQNELVRRAPEWRHVRHILMRDRQDWRGPDLGTWADWLAVASRFSFTRAAPPETPPLVDISQVVASAGTAPDQILAKRIIKRSTGLRQRLHHEYAQQRVRS